MIDVAIFKYFVPETELSAEIEWPEEYGFVSKLEYDGLLKHAMELEKRLEGAEASILKKESEALVLKRVLEDKAKERAEEVKKGL